MNYYKATLLIAKLVYAVIFSLLLSCGGSTTKKTYQPTESDYAVGEKWVWKFKGVSTEGEVRSDGTDTRSIVRMDGGLGMTIENDTIPVADLVKPDESETPMYNWPLEVGKKWKYEKHWTSQDGTTGKQSQDVEILSYKEETVEAGTFMAYTIKFTGEISNSRGFRSDAEDVWLYAPELKNFIKLTQTQGDFRYVEELIEYANPNN